ncbi:sporulation protein [Sporosarcina sp. G11-34]|uniref:sporulation protein n=1 Tax=Sporosarcina sp. G11-34 TaxID=2849605 RepID=UPI0022A9EF3A|nr:sporulation protein [Sporosarcina sp. G11-34]MCZ2258222.1 sporulation protein [Sporosarcina sp. G11-34]
MLKDFSSSIVYGKITLDTIVDGPNIAFGETLSGKVYIEGEESEELIDEVVMELLKHSETKDQVIAKLAFEIVSAEKSKETWMISFELVPDERWEMEADNESLSLRTTMYLKNGVNVQGQDSITYK